MPTVTNVSSTAWPVAVVKPDHSFSPWPFWLLFALVALSVIYFEGRRRIWKKGQRYRTVNFD
jgi:hypothetical protein